MSLRAICKSPAGLIEARSCVTIRNLCPVAETCDLSFSSLSILLVARVYFKQVLPVLFQNIIPYLCTIVFSFAGGNLLEGNTDSPCASRYLSTIADQSVGPCIVWALKRQKMAAEIDEDRRLSQNSVPSFRSFRQAGLDRRRPS